MNTTQTQINTTVIQQNLIQTSIDMNSTSNKVNYRSRSSRHGMKSTKSTKSKRDRYYKRESKYRKESRKELRKELRKESQRTKDRKRRRSLSNNRDKNNHKTHRNKRRKLNTNIVTGPTNNNSNVTSDSINAVKDIKNLVSNSKIKIIPNIPAVLQDKNMTMLNNNILPKTLSQNGGNKNVAVKNVKKRIIKHNSSSDATSTSSAYSDTSIHSQSSTDSDASTASNASSSSYSQSDSEYSTDSSSDNSHSHTLKESNISKSSRRRHRDRRRRHRHRHRNESRHNNSNSNRHRSRTRDRNNTRNINIKKNKINPKNMGMNMNIRGRTPNWFDHQEKEWFKAMEMLTKFNHRKNYRDKFLSIFEDACYNKFKHFWHNNAVPTTQDLKQLESIFEKLYFKQFNSVRQVREYQQNMTMQRPPQPIQPQVKPRPPPPPQVIKPKTIHINPPSTGNTHPVISSYPQIHGHSQQSHVNPSTTVSAPGPNIMSMLNLGDDLNANIQNIQALLAMTSQQTHTQNERRTLRVPSRLQQTKITAHTPIVINNNKPQPQPQIMQMTLPQPTIRKPAALRHNNNNSPLPAEIMVNNPQIIVHQTLTHNNNNGIPLMPPPNQMQHNHNHGNISDSIQELPTPEPILINTTTTHKTEAPPPIVIQEHNNNNLEHENEIKQENNNEPEVEVEIEPVEVMPSPSAPISNDNNDNDNDIEMEEEEDNDIDRSDEQICETLNIPPPPKDPREMDIDNNNEDMVEEEEMDNQSDENISVISDVVTEDDIIISPRCSNEMDNRNDESSTNSMSPEVQIDKSRISNAEHITQQNVDDNSSNNDDEGIDFEQTLNNISDFLAIDNNTTANLNLNLTVNNIQRPQPPPPQPQPQPISECKTNSTNESKVAAQLGIETSWLFSDDDLQNSNANLPGMNNINIPKIINNNPSKTAELTDGMNPYRGDTAPTHYIPPPSYYNPPAPGQDVDRRQLRRNIPDTTTTTNNQTQVQSQIKPRRRAVRRRKPNQSNATTPTPTNAVANMCNGDDNDNDDNKPKQLQRPLTSPKKKRGFFNRIKTGTDNNNNNMTVATTIAMDRHKMIRSRINNSINNNIGNAFAPLNPRIINTNNNKTNMIAGFDMSEANIPKPRKPMPKSFIRINNNNNHNNLIPKHIIVDRKRPTPPINNNIKSQNIKSMSSSKLLSRKIMNVSNTNINMNINKNKMMKKRNKNLIPKTMIKSMTKDVMIDLTVTNNHRLVNHKLNKTRIIRKQPLKNISKLKSKSKSNTPPINTNIMNHKSRSNTPNPNTINIKKPINSKSIMLKKTTRGPIKRTRIISKQKQPNIAPSKLRHHQHLGPKLDAPPTDLSALFDEKPSPPKKTITDNSVTIANNPISKPSNNIKKSIKSKPQASSVPSQPYYDPRGPPPPHGHGHYPPPSNGYYPPQPPPNGHGHYYPHGPPPPHYYTHGPPPPGYGHGHGHGHYPPGYYQPPGAGINYPPQPPPNYNPHRPPPPQSIMPEPNIDNNNRKYKKIAKYRDNVFYPIGYKTWNTKKYMSYIDNSIHERTKLLLFLDIDHTILHSTRDKRGANYLNHKIFGNDIFEINFPNQYNATYYIKFRPSFRKLISQLYPLYDFVLYTMGSRSYAEQVAMIIDEHFRQYIPKTKSKSNVKHNKTFIIGNRIICREDHGNISDKDYKKDVLQFAPIKTEWCMIIDDVPEVWRNRDDIHRVPKYLFWPNPDKTAPGTNHKHEKDTLINQTNNKINIWSKNSITSWLDDKSLIKQEKDTVLLQCIELCKCIHQCYYSSYTPIINNKISTIKIFEKIRGNVIKDISLVFTGVFPTKNAKNDFHWKLAELFGAMVNEKISDNTTHLIGKDSKTSKIQQAIKDGKIEIVHVNWLYQTLFNFGLADCNKFRMFKNGDDKHTPPMHCHVKVKSKRELVSMYQNST